MIYLTFVTGMGLYMHVCVHISSTAKPRSVSRRKTGWEKKGNEVTRTDSRTAEVLNGDFSTILALGCTENIAPKVMLAVSLLL